MKHLLICFMLFAANVKAQTHSLDSFSYDTTIHGWLIPNSFYSYDSIIIPTERKYVGNIVGIYGSGELKIFPAQYIIYKNENDFQIFGMPPVNKTNLIGIYSYEDNEGVHLCPNSICHTYMKGEKSVNYNSKSHKSRCCK